MVSEPLCWNQLRGTIFARQADYDFGRPVVVCNGKVIVLNQVATANADPGILVAPSIDLAATLALAKSPIRNVPSAGRQG
jgi:hypothetical protein